MRTRWDELAEPFDRLSRALGVGDREHLRSIVDHVGWGARSVDEPLLPSGIRHGVPWGLSLSTTLAAGSTPAMTDLRVFLEPQSGPPSRDGYLATAEALFERVADTRALHSIERPQRWWYAVSYGRDRPPAHQAYACIPDTPELGWRVLASRGHGRSLRAVLPARSRVTMLGLDLHAAGRIKLYVLVPDSAPDELPHVDAEARAFAGVLLGTPRRIGWLVSYGFLPGSDEPTSVAVHFGAAVHADAGFVTRSSAELRRRGLPELGDRMPVHFVAYTQGSAPRITRYFLPQVRR